MIKVTENHDSIVLKTDDFTFRMNRYSSSCSGNITKETFNNIEKFIRESGTNQSYGERFRMFTTDPDLIKTLIVPPTNEIKMGDIVPIEYGKTRITGEVIGFTNAYVKVKTPKGVFSVQKMILIS